MATDVIQPHRAAVGTMRSVQVIGAGENGWVEVPIPVAGETDVLVRVRSCGICGSDAMYTALGGIPPRQGATPLGHEVAGEVVEVGVRVPAGVAVGDHVVLDVKLADGLLGGGGPQGGLSPFVAVRDAIPGKHLRVLPAEVPWVVAALNEPMAVALHAVNRSGVKAGDTAVVFGAGPVGLGTVLALRSRGVAHVVVVGRGGPRMRIAREVGADEAIDATREDVAARLIELHGRGSDALGRTTRAGTDVYIDAAGSPLALETAMAAAKARAVITIVGVHKAPIPIDFGRILSQELDLRVSMGYPEEIFQITDAIIADPASFSRIVSDVVPFADALRALELSKRSGAVTKVVVIFD